MLVMLKNNKKTLQQLQCSNIPNGITNLALDQIADIKNLTFLDISFAKNVTDEGLIFFREKLLPIKNLFVNGLISITSVGMIDLINSCKGTLRIFEAALMD
jgi:hypothetical protein